MQSEFPEWHCVRTKPKHEHIAAANLQKNLEIEIFLPRLRIEKATRRGIVRGMEPLFPCYLFARCVIWETLNEIKHTNGVRHIVRFGDRIPKIPDPVIAELRQYFVGEEFVAMRNDLLPGDEVAVAEGALAGMQASVLRHLPAKKRVQILLNILGRPTAVEVDRSAVVLTATILAALPSALVAPQQGTARLFD